jgi:hypothetical protein
VTIDGAPVIRVAPRPSNRHRRASPDPSEGLERPRRAGTRDHFSRRRPRRVEQPYRASRLGPRCARQRYTGRGLRCGCVARCTSPSVSRLTTEPTGADIDGFVLTVRAAALHLTVAHNDVGTRHASSRRRLQLRLSARNAAFG